MAGRWPRNWRADLGGVRGDRTCHICVSTKRINIFVPPTPLSPPPPLKKNPMFKCLAYIWLILFIGARGGHCVHNLYSMLLVCQFLSQYDYRWHLLPTITWILPGCFGKHPSYKTTNIDRPGARSSQDPYPYKILAWCPRKSTRDRLGSG